MAGPSDCSCSDLKFSKRSNAQSSDPPMASDNLRGLVEIDFATCCVVLSACRNKEHTRMWARRRVL